MASTYLADVKLLDLIPSSIAGDPSIIAAATACQPEIDAVTADTPRVLIYPRLEDLPDAVLDAVAWGWHVDGYDLLATRAERLDVVKRFHEYHVHKGTKYGLALYLSTFLKRPLLGASPPSKSFIGASLTDAEHAAWEAPHPEVRSYPFRHGGQRVGAHVGDFAGACFPAITDALLRIGDRVALFDPLTATETALDSLATARDTREAMGVRRVPVALPGQGGLSCFVGRYVAGYLANQQAAARLYVLDQAAPYVEEFERRVALSSRPSLEPFRVGYDWVGEGGSRGRVCFLGNRWPDGYSEAGGGFVSGHFVRSTARDRIYRKTKLFDPARVAYQPADASTFLGAFLLGAHQPHHAEASVDMQRVQDGNTAFVGGYASSRRFFADLRTPEWIALMRRVGRMAVRRSDKIQVSITNRRQARASSGLLAGSVVAGQYQLEVI